MEIDKAGNASVFQSTLTIADAQIASMLMTFAWLLVSIFEPYRGWHHAMMKLVQTKVTGVIS